jgi:hypothetical protein
MHAPIAGIQEIAIGLWRWRAPHPEWSRRSEWEREVASVYYEAPDAVCLFDPLIPPGAERLWAVLDQEIDRAGKSVAVLLTVPWHRRSADVVGARYGSEREGWELSLRSREPPLGVESITISHSDERMFWIPAHRALIAGDVLLGTGSGLKVCPVAWITRAAHYPGDFLASLGGVLELPVERVLVSHGEAVLADGRSALFQAVERARARQRPP